MPAFRNVRRSRRLSRQPPRDPGSDEFDRFDLELMYPPSPVSSPQAGPPSADEAGEPEIDPESPASSPAPPDIVAGERSSHSRKKKPGHIPRPPNAFMIFRSDLWNKEKIKSTVERDHRQISRIAGSLWNSLSDAERAPYHHLAEEAKKEHARKYPQYKYSPIYRRDKPAKRKPKQDHGEKVLRCQTVARLIQRGFEGDDLKQELDRREAGAGSSHLSDSSEYVDDHPRMAAVRPPKQSSSRARPRRERRVRVKDDDDEYVPEEHGHIPIHSPFVKKEIASPDFSRPASCPADEPEVYIPTSDIPALDIGTPCTDEEEEVIKFTNPFPSAARSPHPSFSASMSPDSNSLSDDFLAPVVDETLSPLDRSPSPAGFDSLFDPMSEEPSYGAGFFPATLPAENPYYAPEYIPGGVSSEGDLFPDWVRYQE